MIFYVDIAFAVNKPRYSFVNINLDQLLCVSWVKREEIEKMIQGIFGMNRRIVTNSIIKSPDIYVCNCQSIKFVPHSKQ